MFRIGLFIVMLLGLTLSRTASAQDGIRLRQHAFVGGANHGVWELNTAARYSEQTDGVDINVSTTNIYQAPVNIRALEGVMTGSSQMDVVTGPIAGAVLTKYIQEGLVMDITDLWESEGWLDQYPQSVIDMASHEGRQYFLPQGFQWNPVFYRADIFEQEDLTIPTTWDELLATCETLSERGYRPFTTSVANWTPPTARWFTMLNIRLNGAEFHNRVLAGEESWLDNRLRNVFEHWQAALEHGCFGENIDQVNYRAAVDELVNGDAVMYLLGEWLYESTEEEQEANLQFFRFPTLNEDVPTGAIVHYYGAFIHANTEYPEESRAYLRWLGSPEAQQSVVEDLGRAVMTSAIDSDVMPAYQQAGVDYVTESEALVPLFEVGVFDQQFGGRALSWLARYMRIWQEPDAIDTLLNLFEEERLAQMGG